MQIDFRVVQPAEIEAYLDFLEDIAVWLTARGISQWTPGNFKKSRAYYAQSVANGEAWMALHEGAPVGTLRILDSEPLVWPDVAVEDGVYLYNVAVARHVAGAGLGARLLAHADQIGRARGRLYVRLDCMADNAFLKRYYAQAGFVSRGDIEVEYPAPIGVLKLHRFEREVTRVTG